MSLLLRWWKPRNSEASSAPVVARERLQVLLSHERTAAGQSNLLGLIKEDVLAAIKRHITVPAEAVHVSRSGARLFPPCASRLIFRSRGLVSGNAMSMMAARK